MLPWEHLAVGYLCYSLWAHLRHRRRPTGAPVVVLAIATGLPDLVDKPLGWWLGVLPSVGLAHSLFFAVPVLVLAWLLAGARLALPFGVGYLSHLAADVVYSALLGGSLDYAFLAWPLVDRPTPDAPGLFSQTRYWLARYAEVVTSPEGLAYLGFELALVGSALLLWAYDGFPGLTPASFRRETDATTDY